MKLYRASRIVNMIKFSLALNVIVFAILCQVTYANPAEDDDIRLRRVVPIMFSHRMSLVDSTNMSGTLVTGTIIGGTPAVMICTESMEDFPSFFTDAQRKQGAIILPFIIAIYCFTNIALICDNYFLPCVQSICDAFNLSEDVAAATFMSIATSAPELFSNIIGTFITESDIGIGTVVGSSMFNTLGVAAIGGLAATTPIQLDWWPLTRDSAIYICSIILLVALTWDGEIFWYEALILFIVYFVYLTVMFQNGRITQFFKTLMKRYCTRKISEEPIKQSIELSTISTIDGELNRYIEHKEQSSKVREQKEKKLENGQTRITITTEKQAMQNLEDNDNDSSVDPLCRIPKGGCFSTLFFFYAWPIKLLLFCTIPDCRRYKRAFPVTFIMCVIWMAVTSYMVSWMVTIIGSTFEIQDSVLGLTFLAAGGCLPEAISITIMSRKGEGRMGVSNALGANTMNILLSLGLPWFIKTLSMVAEHGSQSASIRIVSGSLEYTILALIMVAITLYACLSWNKFQLSRKSGAILMCFYALFLISAILSEMYLFQTQQCRQLSS